MPIKDLEQRNAVRRAYMKGIRDDARAIIIEAKSVPCADCGQEYPYYVMQFDHVRGVKLFTIAKFVQTSPSKGRLASLRAEIEKCDVVCANCHALRHGGTGRERADAVA